jgi:hypothetical protein
MPEPGRGVSPNTRRDRHVGYGIEAMGTMYTPGNWSKATCVKNIFSDAPRRSMKRETISVERTLQRTETAALEVQIVALKETNGLLASQLNEARRERDELQQDRDHWRAMATAPQPPTSAVPAPSVRRGWFWNRSDSNKGYGQRGERG